MQDFTGITAPELKRAEENIFYLDESISLFFQEGAYPVLPNDNREEFLKAIHYHRNRVGPYGTGSVFLQAKSSTISGLASITLLGLLGWSYARTQTD